MATSKTLTPTNVTISIPEFTDQPDQRVNSNCIDKEADAINALNGKKADKTHFTQSSYNYRTYNTWQSAMAANKATLFPENGTYTFGFLTEGGAPHVFTLIKDGNYINGTHQVYNGYEEAVYSTDGGTTWNVMSLSGKIANKVKAVTLEKTVNNGYFTIDISTDIGSGYSIASINTVYKSGTTADQLNLCYTIDGNVVYVRTGSGNQLANGTVIKVLVVGIYI